MNIFITLRNILRLACITDIDEHSKREEELGDLHSLIKSCKQDPEAFRAA